MSCTLRINCLRGRNNKFLKRKQLAEFWVNCLKCLFGKTIKQSYRQINFYSYYHVKGNVKFWRVTLNYVRIINLHKIWNNAKYDVFLKSSIVSLIYKLICLILEYYLKYWKYNFFISLWQECQLLNSYFFTFTQLGVICIFNWLHHTFGPVSRPLYFNGKRKSCLSNPCIFSRFFETFPIW